MADSKLGILVNLFIPQRRKPNPKHAIPEKDKNLKGKTIVFTGGTDGMGRVAVDMLYAMGAHVVVLGRKQSRGNEIINELKNTKGKGSASFQVCDLSSMDSVKACADRIKKEYAKIDILVNCAGVNMPTKVITEDGFEMNWAVDYLAPYLLTNLLLEPLNKSKHARVVNLITNIAFVDSIDFNTLEKMPDFATKVPYAESKLSLSMFSIEMAEKLKGTGVSINYLHPGNIRSNLLRHLKGFEKIMGQYMLLMTSPTIVGADRVVRLAISSEFDGVTGTYLAEDTIKPPHKEAQITSKRKHIERITQKALSRWL